MGKNYDPEAKLRSKKVYWALSEFAKSIIEQDLDGYNKQKLTAETKLRPSDIFNKIFENYHEKAFSSISIGNTVKQKEVFNKSLMELIKNKYLSYEGIKQNYRFSENTCKIMKNSSDVLAIYSDKWGKYFRAVLEEYAQLPSSERERILYHETYKQLKKHANNFPQDAPIQIEVYSSNYNGELKKSSYLFYPYKILPDKKRMHYYLVGLSKTEGTDLPFSQYPVRLSNICGILEPPKNSETLDAVKLKEAAGNIDKQLKVVDVPYMNSTYLDNIQVRFTEIGLSLLHRVQYKRPPFDCSEEDKHICFFHCTKDELFNYITVFGGEAKLENPDNDEGIRDLLERLQKFYSKANEVYNSQK